MEGHLLAPMLEVDAPEFPFLALLVSGGHTMLVSVQALGEYQVLGSTLDDAVGEAFDKTAKLLGLSYPGGPALAALAAQGNDAACDLPRPMLNREGFDFSFSGLKTAVMLQVREATAQGNLDAMRADIAASFQRAAIDTLVARTLKAAKSERAQRIVVAGGVGANTLLREELAKQFEGDVFYPRLEYCTDNGAMIAIAGALRLADARKPATIQAMARWSLDSLTPPQSEKFEHGYATGNRYGICARTQSRNDHWHLGLGTQNSPDREHRSRNGRRHPTAAETDSIDDTLNYKAISKRVQQFVADSEFQLVETMAEKIAELVLQEFKVPWIQVRVSKPGAIRGAKNVGILIHRSKA